ncbi:MAG: Holliday junction resolvase RuvX [Candidatus Omnitrophota bacterium]
MRTLGIDFGSKRIGVAVSDPLRFTAQGLETIENTGRRKTFEALLKICKDYGVSEAVIGLPINMNGSMGPKAKEVLEWVPEAEKALGIPVKTWDERLSSREVGRLMIEEGLSRQKQKKHSDRLAATLLLQSYLDFSRK